MKVVPPVKAPQGRFSSWRVTGGVQAPPILSKWHMVFWPPSNLNWNQVLSHMEIRCDRAHPPSFGSLVEGVQGSGVAQTWNKDRSLMSLLYAPARVN